MIRRPPRSTLFPSRRSSDLDLAGLENELDGLVIVTETQAVVGVDTDEIIELEDRKSTRLNSSHVEISYAVFCLKKKKTQTTPAAVLQQTVCHETDPHTPSRC